MMRDWDRGIYPGDVILTSDPYKCSASISHTNDWLVLVPIFFEDELVGWSSAVRPPDGRRRPAAGLAADGREDDLRGGADHPADQDRRARRGAGGRPAADPQQRPPAGDEPGGPVRDRRRLPRRRAARDRAVRALRQGRLPRRAAGAARPHARGDADADRARDPRGAADLRGLDRRRRARQRPVQDAADDLARGRPRLVRLVGHGPAGHRPDELLPLRGDVQDVHRGLPDHGQRPPDPLQRRLLSAAARRDAGGVRCSTRATRRRSAAARTRSTRLFDVLGGALCKQAPELNTAAGYGTSPYMLYSGLGRGRASSSTRWRSSTAGSPGRPIGDGMDGHSWWPLFENIPTEYLEAYYPLRIDGYTTVTDSGGAGLHRGGNGVEKRYVYLEPGQVSIHDDRWLTRPWGVLGGEPGERSTKLLRRADGTEQVLPAKCDEVEVAARRHARLPHGGRRRLEGPPRPARRGGRARRGLRPGVAREGAGGLRRRARRRRDGRRGGDRGRARRASATERGDGAGFDFGPPLEETLAALRGRDRAAGAEARRAAALVAARGRARRRARACARRAASCRRRDGRRERCRPGAGVRRRRGLRRRPAVVVVDLDPRLHRPGLRRSARTSTTWSPPRAACSTPRARRRAGLLHDVVYDAPRERAAAVFLRKVPALAASCGRARAGSRSTRGSAARPDEPLLVKAFASAFFGHATGARWLAGRDALVVCGATTSGCVRATVVDALQHGLAPDRRRARRSATAGPTPTRQSLLRHAAEVRRRAAASRRWSPALGAAAAAGAARRARLTPRAPPGQPRSWRLERGLYVQVGLHGYDRPGCGTRRSIWRLPSNVSVPGSPGPWRPPRRAGWPSGSRCTSPTRSPAAAAGTRSCARPRPTIPALRRRDAIGAWVAGAGAGGVRVGARRRRRARAAAAPPPAGAPAARAGRHARRRGRGGARRRRRCSSRVALARRRRPAARRRRPPAPVARARRRCSRVLASPRWRAASRACAASPPASAAGCAPLRAPGRLRARACCPGSSRAARAAPARWRASSPPSGCPSRREAVLLVMFAQGGARLVPVRARRRSAPGGDARRELRARHRHRGARRRSSRRSSSARARRSPSSAPCSRWRSACAWRGAGRRCSRRSARRRGGGQALGERRPSAGAAAAEPRGPRWSAAASVPSAVAERRWRRRRRRCRTRSGCRWRPRRARWSGPTAAPATLSAGLRTAAATAMPTATAKPTWRLGTAASSL